MIIASELLLAELPPGVLVPAGLPAPSRGPGPPAGDAAEAVGHVLAAAAAARLQLAWGRAETHAREAADLAARTGARSLAAASLNELAAIRLDQGAPAGVAGLCDRASEWTRAGPELVRARVNAAVAAAMESDVAGADAGLREAEDAVEGGDRWGSQLLRLNRAALLLLRGELSAAADAAAAALRAGRREKEDHWTALAALVAASVHRARGSRNVARARLMDAVRGFTRAGDRLRLIQSHYLLGELAYEAEDPIRAGSHYRDGLALARGAGAAREVELLTLRFEHR